MFGQKKSGDVAILHGLQTGWKYRGMLDRNWN